MLPVWNPLISATDGLASQNPYEILKNYLSLQMPNDERPVLELSGGLESSSVLLALRAVAPKQQIACAHYYNSAVGSSNELEHARRVAQSASAQLGEIDTDVLSFAPVKDLPRVAKPHIRYCLLAFNQHFASRLEQRENSVLISGHGGDSLFLAPPPFGVLADAMLTLRWRQLFRIAMDLALIRRTSLTHIAWQAIKSSLAADPSEGALRRGEQYLVTAINERIKRSITVNYVSQVLNRPATALSEHQSGASASERQKNLASDRASTVLIDTLTHADTVKAFSNEAGELRQLDRVYKAREQASVELARKMEIFGVLQLLIVGIGLATLTSLACRDIFAHRLTVGDFALLNGYLLQFTLPLSSFGYAIREARLGLFNLEELLEKLETRWEFKSASDALFERAPSIQFKHASFSHAPGKDVLRDASFTVPAGAFCAIVGPTGAGKSTLMKLLLRLYSLDSGAILIDGRPIESFAEQKLRQSVSYATQDAHLLDRSLRENISFACPHASDAELERAISTAALTPVIAAAHAGLETQIGERAKLQSAGGGAGSEAPHSAPGRRMYSGFHQAASIK
ncbi:hypothetical protein BGZ97_010134 [Linnemannia gamsii]|uniref:ABC transmembrane type-1 domain-containing protein n=1 Tax=Linnemannia gamsii TaxID=64522 RepID=A0A9P6UW36_9FUNG|nr:hypothetical protein BGZ97_010134 [Linnemannia gamsii]